MIPQETGKPSQAPQAPHMEQEILRRFHLVRLPEHTISLPSAFSLRRDYHEVPDHSLSFDWSVSSPRCLQYGH